MKKITLLTLALSALIFAAKSQIVITEIMYNPPESGTDSLEYIEFYNLSDAPVDVTGYSLTEGVVFDFPSKEIASKSYLVACVDSVAMQNTFGIACYEWTSGGLSNGGEDIVLINSAGATIDSVNYDDGSGWATDADGNGGSLHRVDYKSSPNDPTNWVISSARTGILTDGKQIKGSPNTDEPNTFLLQLLHASDLEGGVEAIVDAPNFAAIVDLIEDEVPNTLVLSAGDNYIPGPFFGASDNFEMRPTLQAVYQGFFNEPGLNNIREAAGRADVTIMNIIGFDASALGNHEFDASTAAVADIIKTDIRGTELGDVRWLGAQFPYLSANLDFTNDGELSDVATDQILENTAFLSSHTDLTAAASAPKIAPATFITVGSEKVGIVGATTQLLASISSPGDAEVLAGGSNDMDALAAIIQPQIDVLENMGINKIVLVSHLQQFALESALAGKLSGIDIIVAGGSDAILANEMAVLRDGDVAAETYPVIKTNLDGDHVALVSTDGQYNYVGRLVAEFDIDGKLIPSSIFPFESNPIATTSEVVTTLYNSADPFEVGSKGYWTKFIADSVQKIVTTRDGIIVGKTDVYLDGRRAKVRTEETNLGNLTADANLWFAQLHDADVKVSLKNGGGIRAAIGEINTAGEFLKTPANPEAGKLEGDISVLDLENTLKFDNKLWIITLDATGLKEILEHGVAETEIGNTPGRFPQLAGGALTYNITKDAGERVESFIIDANTPEADTVVFNYAVHGNPDREIKVVTLNFLAGGGDGYPYEALQLVDPIELDATPEIDQVAGEFDELAYGGEQDALAEYLYETTIVSTTPYAEEETLAEFDTRIVRVTVVTSTTDNIEFTVYPNPAYETIFFSEKVGYTVSNIAGEVVANGNDDNVSVNHLAKGAYIITFDNGTQASVIIE